MSEKHLKHSDSKISIDIEEFIFGHVGGMRPIAWTHTLSRDEVDFLYSIIGNYQGAIDWENGNWALSWRIIQFEETKVAVTVIFPDNDMSGRATVFGHTLILKMSDYLKIDCNPFVLMESGFFSEQKDLPKKLERRRESLRQRRTFDYNKNIPREIFDCFFTLFPQILAALARDKKVFISGPVPANKFIQLLRYFLPPVLWAMRPFSTLEINKSAEIEVAVVPQSTTTRAWDNEEAVHLFMDQNREKDLPDLPVSTKILHYIQTVRDLHESGVNLDRHFFQVENYYGYDMDSKELLVFLKYHAGGKFFWDIDPFDLDMIWEKVKDRPDEWHRFLDCSLGHLQKQEEFTDQEPSHDLVNKVIAGHHPEEYWDKYKPVYKHFIKLGIKQTALVLKSADCAAKDYKEKFKDDLLPLIINTARREIELPPIKKDALKQCFNLLVKPEWFEIDLVMRAAREYCITAVQIEWDEIIPVFLKMPLRHIGNEKFEGYIDGIIAGIREHRGQASDVIYQMGSLTAQKSELTAAVNDRLFYICSQYHDLLGYNSQHLSNLLGKLVNITSEIGELKNWIETIDLLVKGDVKPYFKNWRELAEKLLLLTKKNRSDIEYRQKIGCDILPAFIGIIENMMSDNQIEWEDLKPYFDELLEPAWLKYSYVVDFVGSGIVHAFSTNRKDAEQFFVMQVSVNFKGDNFEKIIDQIACAPMDPQAKITDFIYSIAMQIARTPELQEVSKCRKLYTLCLKCSQLFNTDREKFEDILSKYVSVSTSANDVNNWIDGMALLSSQTMESYDEYCNQLVRQVVRKNTPANFSNIVSGALNQLDRLPEKQQLMQKLIHFLAQLDILPNTIKKIFMLCESHNSLFTSELSKTIADKVFKKILEAEERKKNVLHVLPVFSRKPFSDHVPRVIDSLAGQKANRMFYAIWVRRYFKGNGIKYSFEIAKKATFEDVINDPDSFYSYLKQIDARRDKLGSANLEVVRKWLMHMKIRPDKLDTDNAAKIQDLLKKFGVEIEPARPSLADGKLKTHGGSGKETKSVSASVPKKSGRHDGKSR